VPASYIDPVIASRIRAAWGNLAPDIRTRITARLNAKRVAKGFQQPVPLQELVTLDAAVGAVAVPKVALTSQVDSSGEIWGTGRYEHLDPGWAESIACWLETMHDHHPFNHDAPVIQIPDTVKIAIAGDWGCGDWRDAGNPAPSTRVAAQMAALKPDITIHLGDVYYAGTKDEQAHLFAGLWPSGTIGSFALNGNHEMYSGGVGYFEVGLASPKFAGQRGASFFALENSNWVIVGLDSAYYADPEGLYMDGSLRGNGYPDFQSEFLREQVAKGKKVIVLTHHNGLTDDGRGLTALWDEVMSIAMRAPSPPFWYWGHEHFAAAYARVVGQPRCRCVGHGGVPYGVATVLNSPNVEWYETRLANDPEIPQRVMNGFCQVALEGSNIVETFYDENGGIAWQSK
jgi:hypothetical protein